MIYGAIAGLLAAIGYTLVIGKLQLTKNRIVYATPARIIALLGLLPLLGLVFYVKTTGHTVLEPGGMGRFVGAIAACILIMYGLGWPLGRPPR